MGSEKTIWVPKGLPETNIGLQPDSCTRWIFFLRGLFGFQKDSLNQSLGSGGPPVHTGWVSIVLRGFQQQQQKKLSETIFGLC
jgi:hypothetical protein